MCVQSLTVSSTPFTQPLAETQIRRRENEFVASRQERWLRGRFGFWITPSVDRMNPTSMVTFEVEPYPNEQ
jgi:hypothetical protein